ncbi:glycosyltransferase [Gloeocapsa sp. PCC 73106]|uniref:glycosyltransferase n=1 Tax=Gloeocapsa sp. PCC 73106 TaxID=102232 RepID=UPI0002AC60E1|nr:glycosyltransferase [Gloeocapsa sp. PCC 73106]ELR97320.1 glycosyltransferase, MGT family [Gloeocapsa sp. PCC 73106]
MTHFGILSPAATGHLNTMIPLGKELQRRGHRVTLFGVLDTESKAIAAGLDFCVFGESDFPKGAIAESMAKFGKLEGIPALRYTMNAFKKSATVLLREGPSVIQKAGVEALLIDQTLIAAPTLAEFLQLPYITVCSALLLNSEETIPPYFMNWNYSTAWWARLRNRFGYKISNQIHKPIVKLIEEYRQTWKLSPYADINESYSKLAQISQQPAELEFPRSHLPECFHFTGPYHSSTGRISSDFPYEKLTEQPLIYASMGTLQNRLIKVFEDIATACAGLDVQLVISLGGAAKPESLPQLSGTPLVVEYAPQLELLEKATLVITHGGMNTTLECLGRAIPMVVIPVANEQPGIAARIAWTGCGEVVPLKKVNPLRLRTAIERVLREPSYKENAIRLQQAILNAGGVTKAVDIIEQAIAIGEPVKYFSV